MTSLPTEKRSWVVRARCVVIKEIICDNCTKEEAMKDVWEHAVSEHESDQMDWEIVGVSPNE